MSASVYLPLVNGSISPTSNAPYASKQDAINDVEQLHAKLKGLNAQKSVHSVATLAAPQDTASSMCSWWWRTYPQNTFRTSGTPTR